MMAEQAPRFRLSDMPRPDDQDAPGVIIDGVKYLWAESADMSKESVGEIAGLDADLGSVQAFERVTHMMLVGLPDDVLARLSIEQHQSIHDAFAEHIENGEFPQHNQAAQPLQG